MTVLPELPAPLRVRHPAPGDHSSITEVVPRWWSDSRSPEAGQALAALVQPLFLEHFADTSLVVHDGQGALAAFFIALHSQSRPRESYIHFVGIDPRFRGAGIGRAMYEWFFALASAGGHDRVSAVTGPDNHGSIAFHASLGFAVDTAGPKVRFSRPLR